MFGPLLPPTDIISHYVPGKAGEWREYAAGWGSGIINISLTFPVNKTMFRQQLHGISAWDAASQLRAEGILSLYRGILPPLMQKSATTALMFGSFEQYKRALIEKQMSVSSSVVLAAFCAGCTEAVLTPFERIQTLMLDHSWEGKFRNTPHAFVSLSQYGVREYYRGFVYLSYTEYSSKSSSLPGYLPSCYGMVPAISSSSVVVISSGVYCPPPWRSSVCWQTSYQEPV